MHQAYDPEHPAMGCYRVAVDDARGICRADLMLRATGRVVGWLSWVGDLPVLLTTVVGPVVLRDYNGTGYVVAGARLLYAGPLLQ